jgi:sigma-54 dependent transcriptional regulator, acetoin dehydrogenase operon transcriptional activator AcoR
VLDEDREYLLSGELDRIQARPEIIQSWRRCRMSGVDPDRLELRYEPPAGEGRLVRRAVPLLSAMAGTMIGARTSLLLTDRDGRLIWRWAENTELGRELERKSVVEGTCWDETAVGTGGVGTSLETMQVLTVIGSEHYVDALHPLACVAAPIRHPITHRVEGVLNITSMVTDFHPLMKPTLLKLVREVESELFGESSVRDRQLFQHFLGERRRSRAAVVAVNDDIVITNRSGARLDVDPRAWWTRMGEDLDDGDDPVVRTDRNGRSVELRRLIEEGTSIGLMIVVEEPRHHAPAEGATAIDAGRTTSLLSARRVRSVDGPRLDAPLWRDVVADTRHVYAAGDPILVTGEPGSGKTTLLRELGEKRIEVHDAAALDIGGRSEWFASVGRLLDGDQSVVIAHLEALDDAAAAGLTALLASAPGHALVGATWTALPDTLSGARLGLRARFNIETVEVPPLRERVEDIEPLLCSLLEQEQLGRDLHLTSAALDVLRHHRWTGNVTELRALVRWMGRQTVQFIDVNDLPSTFRVERSRRRLSPMESAEAELIVKALEQCAGNKVLAAKTLGIARSSLYRKIRAYRLDD